MTNPVPVLSDDALREIESRDTTRLRGSTNHLERIVLTVAERDALCATVRALREREKNYARVLSDRLREMNALSELVACEHNSDPDSDAEPCGTCQTCLQSENTALREQLAQSQSELSRWRGRWSTCVAHGDVLVSYKYKCPLCAAGETK